MYLLDKKPNAVFWQIYALLETLVVYPHVTIMAGTLWLGFLLLCIASSGLATSPTRVNLTGTDWVIRNDQGNVTNVSATVPGQVHLDLLRAKVIQDPYYGYHDLDYQWIAFSNWTYRKTFQVQEDLLEFDTVWLECYGLDTAITISINTQKTSPVLPNQHRRFYIDVKDLLSEGENVIEVFIESPITYSDQVNASYPYPVPTFGSYIKGGSRNFIRKAQSDFGWDWGPAFVPSGISDYIGLVGFNVGLVTDAVPQVYSDSSNEMYVSTLVCSFMTGNTGGVMSVVVSVAGKEVTSVFNASKSGELCGRIQTNFVLSEIQLWYPSGYGKQPMYDVTIYVNLKSADTISEVKMVKKIGFRRIELIQDDLPDGKTFYFRINGIPLFVKGSNWIPADAFEGRVTQESLQKLLQSAVLSNQNMVRVWGGGIYQRDDFYTICDELGLMVWQEFMFAVSLYPRDGQFLLNVQEEVKYQVRRLGHHPSIVLWSGNNENQDIATQHGTIYIVDYSVLYDGTVRPALLEEDRSRPFWPASPSNGYLVMNATMDLYVQRWGLSGDTHYGDVHRYDYNDMCTNVTFFPRPRFASEFGFQGYPSIHAWLQVSDPSMWGNTSPFMEHRQHHPDGNTQLLSQMKNFFHIPNNTNVTRQFEDFVYLTQVVQSLCIGSEMEHYRRIRNESYTMGTLYWQLNDIWQAQSWASIEYDGTWKLLHYRTMHSYAKILISPYDLDGNISAYAVSDDHLNDHICDLIIEVTAWKDGRVMDLFKVGNIKVSMLHSEKVWTNTKSAIFEHCPGKINGCFLIFKLISSGATLADSLYLPVNLADVVLQKPNITISNQRIVGQKAMFTLKCVAPAPYVYLYTTTGGYFNDNNFMILPGVSKSITFTGYGPLDTSTFWQFLQVKTVIDTYT